MSVSLPTLKTTELLEDEALQITIWHKLAEWGHGETLQYFLWHDLIYATEPLCYGFKFAQYNLYAIIERDSETGNLYKSKLANFAHDSDYALLPLIRSDVDNDRKCNFVHDLYCRLATMNEEDPQSLLQFEKWNECYFIFSDVNSELSDPISTNMIPVFPAMSLFRQFLMPDDMRVHEDKEISLPVIILLCKYETEAWQFVVATPIPDTRFAGRLVCKCTGFEKVHNESLAAPQLLAVLKNSDRKPIQVDHKTMENILYCLKTVSELLSIRPMLILHNSKAYYYQLSFQQNNKDVVCKLTFLKDNPAPECCACMNNHAEMQLKPCKHICLCFECYEKIEKCPMCRVKITDADHLQDICNEKWFCKKTANLGYLANPYLIII